MRFSLPLRKQAVLPPDNEPIEWVVPDCSIQRRALEEIPSSQRRRESVVGQLLFDNLLRYCLKRYGDDELNYASLTGNALDNLFSQKQKGLLIEALNRSLRPNEAEKRWFENSLSMEYRGEETETKRWEAEILLGSDLDDLNRLNTELARAKLNVDNEDSDVDEEDVDELESKIEAVKDRGARLEGVVPGSRHQRQARERVANQFSDKPILADFQSQNNLVRGIVEKINGENVDYQALAGTSLDKRLHPKEQHLIVEFVSDVTVPDEQERDDFLSTVADAD